MSAFEQADAFVAGTEAGYVNNPADPGGETKYGIAKRAHPNVDIGALTLEQAQALRRPYWDAAGCDDLPAPLALLVYDSSVNNGPETAVRLLQLAVGAHPDGKIGPATLAACDWIAAAGGGANLCAEFIAQRIVYMSKLPTWPTFALGWSRRLALLPFQSMTMKDAK